MKILLIGASGMIGSRVLKEAVSRGHDVLAAARHPDKIEPGPKVTPVGLDVTDTEALTAVAREVDLVISAVSPRNSGNAEEDAAKFSDSLVTVQRETGKRILVVGGAGTLHLPDGSPVAPTVPEPYRGEAIAMRKSYGTLVDADIDFAFLAPAGMISPGERTGKFRLGGRSLLIDDDGDSRISAEDYAVALIDEMETPRHHRTVFTVAY